MRETGEPEHEYLRMIDINFTINLSGKDDSSMPGKTNGLFSKKIVANKRTFFMDIRETRDGTPYLVISAMQRNQQGEPENARIFVFPDQLHAFHAGFDEAVSAMIARLPPQK
jgi:hypothetical protein